MPAASSMTSMFSIVLKACLSGSPKNTDLPSAPTGPVPEMKA